MNKNNLFLKIGICAVCILVIASAVCITLFKAPREKIPANDISGIDSGNNTAITELSSKTGLPHFSQISEVKEKIGFENNYYRNHFDVDLGFSNISKEMNFAVDEMTGSMPAADPEASFPAADGVKDYDGTNLQVEGVDEADIVKTDGDFLYIADRNIIRIVDIRDPENIALAAAIDTSEASLSYVEGMYVIEDKLVLVGNVYYPVVFSYDSGKNLEGISEGVREYTYSRYFTSFVVYDISDKTQPTFIRNIELEGSPISTRMIGTKFVAVMQKNPNYWYYYGYDQIFDENILPAYKDTSVSDELSVPAVSDVCYIPGSDDNSFMTIAYFDTVGGELQTETILGAGSTIYVNEKNLYISRSGYGSSDAYFIKYSIENGIQYVALAEAKGYVYSQYAMDEYNGYFRAAVTVNENNSNSVYVFDENMELVGLLENLAYGERIYSARYENEKLYMVTYRQVDPLFVIDISDPSSPFVEGELKIPGYSEYMHKIGEGYYIGFGRDTRETFYRDEFGKEIPVGTVDMGMKVSLFDLTDDKNPREIQFVSLGNGYSEAEYNNKCFFTALSKGFFAFPIENEATSYRSCIAVIRFDSDNGFALSDPIYLVDNEADYRGWQVRAVRSGDIFFTVYANSVFAHNIDSDNFDLISRVVF